MTDPNTPLPLSDIAPRAEQTMVQMRDGVRLATDVYLPADRSSIATVLVRTPYDKGAEFTFLPRLGDLFNAHGFALVGQDVRGRGRSEGERHPFEHEVDDGYDSLEWVASQIWSNGRVGMFGDSYLGFTSLAAAVSGHPALKAIVPRMIGTERGVNHAGVIGLESVEWAANYWMDNCNYSRPVDWGVRPLSQIVERSAGRPCSQLDRLHEIARGGAQASNPAFFGTDDPRGKISIPTLHWTGFWDLRAGPAIADYMDMRRRPEIADKQFLILDAVDHEFYGLDYEGPAAGLGEAAGPEVIDALLPDYTNAVIAFFNEHVRGFPAPDVPRVRWHLSHVGWRSAEDWPPRGVVTKSMFLSDLRAATESVDGGRLGESREEGSAVGWTHNPLDPVPNNVLSPWSILSDPPDEREVERRGDVLTFTSDALEVSVDIVGPVELTVAIEADSPSMHVIAKLVDVWPSGVARRILLDACEVKREGYQRPMTLQMGDTGYRLQARHRLRLEIACSCYPLYELHPGTGEDPWLAEDRVSVGVRLLGAGARLDLSTLPSDRD